MYVSCSLWRITLKRYSRNGLTLSLIECNKLWSLFKHYQDPLLTRLQRQGTILTRLLTYPTFDFRISSFHFRLFSSVWPHHWQSSWVIIHHYHFKERLGSCPLFPTSSWSTRSTPATMARVASPKGNSIIKAREKALVRGSFPTRAKLIAIEPPTKPTMEKSGMTIMTPQDQATGPQDIDRAKQARPCGNLLQDLPLHLVRGRPLATHTKTISCSARCACAHWDSIRNAQIAAQILFPQDFPIELHSQSAQCGALGQHQTATVTPFWVWGNVRSAKRTAPSGGMREMCINNITHHLLSSVGTCS